MLISVSSAMFGPSSAFPPSHSVFRATGGGPEPAHHRDPAKVEGQERGPAHRRVLVQPLRPHRLRGPAAVHVRAAGWPRSSRGISSLLPLSLSLSLYSIIFSLSDFEVCILLRSLLFLSLQVLSAQSLLAAPTQTKMAAFLAATWGEGSATATGNALDTLITAAVRVVVATTTEPLSTGDIDAMLWVFHVAPPSCRSVTAGLVGIGG